MTQPHELNALQGTVLYIEMAADTILISFLLISSFVIKLFCRKNNNTRPPPPGGSSSSGSSSARLDKELSAHPHEALPKYKRDLVHKLKVLRSELQATQPQTGHCRMEIDRSEIFEVC